MRINRRTFLWISAAGIVGCSRNAPGALERGIQYLLAQQADDGGFHSTTYGLLRSGQSLTPFILGALLDVPESLPPRPAGGIARAFEFIRKNTNANGELGRMDET